MMARYMTAEDFDSAKQVIHMTTLTDRKRELVEAEMPEWDTLKASQRLKIHSALDKFADMKATSEDTYNAIREALATEE